MQPSCAVRKSRSNRGSVLLTSALGLAVLCISHGPSFVGTRLPLARGPSSPHAVGPEDYAELSRVEDLIYDSCIVMEGQQEMQCLRVWDKLKKFHKESALECNLDDMRCVVLDVLDRLCKGIDGQDGLILLNKVSTAVLAFRQKFVTWDSAFEAADTDGSGDIDLDELIAFVGPRMTRNEVKLVFVAADANGDGVISREEFSDFLTAAVFAEEPLRQLEVDPVPQKQPDFNDYLTWSTSGRVQSWAGLSKLVL
mmetsp:Transcript_90104/g.209629  ORF Transcript_90104/g.209629 Transcript_90104/m.209629 type:complete len:253 (+) Transcript_90104:88-846(+)